MAQIILTFGLKKEKLRAVRSAALKNRMQVKEISRINYGQKLGFLAGYKQTGAASIPLKAILTPHNIFWTAEALYQELFKEHLRFI